MNKHNIFCQYEDRNFQIWRRGFSFFLFILSIVNKLWLEKALFSKSLRIKILKIDLYVIVDKFQFLIKYNLRNCSGIIIKKLNVYYNIMTKPDGWTKIFIY
jgi:hypothetical protein